MTTLAALAMVTLMIAPVRAASSAAARKDARPNIIIIMLDDMGWSDLGCYGGEVHTPNMDQLASTGLRFTQFYNTGRCCPTRASLMTGLYPHQAGVGAMTFDQGPDHPAFRGQLQPNCVTIAQVMRQAGYRTAMVGKWHLSVTRTIGPPNGAEQLKWLNHQGYFDRDFADPATYPVARGFEEHYGIIWGVADKFDPFSLVHNTTPVTKLPKHYFIADDLTDHAIDYIHKYTAGNAPMFLYLAYTCPHWPIQAPPEDIAKYKDRYVNGWQPIREARYQRQVKMGLIDPKTTALSQRIDPDHLWSDEKQQQAWEARAMATHAAMIDRVDQNVGRIIKSLRDLHQFDNTLIFVLSDNGASPERPDRPGFDRPSETRDGRKMHYNNDRSVVPGSEVAYYGIGHRWANVANTPLRYWKAEQFEGGIRTPLIVHWPDGLKTKPGEITTQVGHVMDLMATCVDIGHAKYPAMFDGHNITPLEGLSLGPILRGRQREGHDVICFEHEGNRAIRESGWKLVAHRGQHWELYHIAVDGSETHNVAADEPQRVAAMEAKWQQWALRVHAVDAATPQIANRPLHITAEVKAASPRGVVIAQGGDRQGFALHFIDGKPAFDVRINGKVTRLTAEHPATGDIKLTATLDKDHMTLVVDNDKPLSIPSPGLIPAQPLDALNIGFDNRTAAGDYQPPNRFNGRIITSLVTPGPAIQTAQ